MSIRTSVTQYDGFMLRRYSKTGHWGTFEHFRDIETSNHVTGLTILFLHFSPQLTNTPANFVLLSSGKKTDFTDRKAYLPLMSGKMANFTDRMIYFVPVVRNNDWFYGYKGVIASAVRENGYFYGWRGHLVHVVRENDRFYGQMQNNRDFTLNHKRRSLELGPKVHEKRT